MAADLPITVVLDIDGTLVDTNYQHAIAWHRALRDHGYVVQVWEIHRHIGMGGDQLVGQFVLGRLPRRLLSGRLGEGGAGEQGGRRFQARPGACRWGSRVDTVHRSRRFGKDW